MKTIKWILKTTSFLLLISLVMISCKKKKTAPTLTLNGATQITLCLGETYTEAGASALDAYGDNVDVVISGDVNTSLVGTYTIEYTATDKNNNETSALTSITIEMCASSLLGDYTITHDCQVLGIDIVSADQSILPGLNEDQFIIDNFNFAISQLTASVDGLTITIPQSTFTIGSPPLSTDVTISGVGVVDESGTEMVITYTYDAGIAGSGTCTATYTKA